MMKILKDYKLNRKINLLLSILLFSASIQAQDNSPLNMINNVFKLTWLEPYGNVKEVGKHQKLELGLRLNDEIDAQINEFINNKKGLNPYNPEDINVEFVFTSPSFNERLVYAFYYQECKRAGESWEQVFTEYNWRLRFAPDEIGKWKFVVKIYVKEQELISFGSVFKCVKSDAKGIIKRNYKGDESDRYLYLSETKKTFFTIGHNIAHSAYYKLTPQKVDRHKKWLKQLADNGGNFFRLELGGQNALPDWNNYKDYTSKMPEMYEFDDITSYANQLGLYFILFRHHTEMIEGESWDNVRWETNPYHKGFNLDNRLEYFRDEEVIKWQKNALRYIFSRWGYNTSFAFYEYQEIDNWYDDLRKQSGYSEKQAIHLFTEWYIKQKEYIKELGYNKLFINTYATTPDYELEKNSQGLFANSDVIGFHKYGQDKDINYNSRYDKAEELFEAWNKPFFVEEMGVGAYGTSDFLPIYKCNNSEFHNAIWSTAMMGGAGSGMTWWWDRGIHDFGYYNAYNAMLQFFKNEDMEGAKYQPQKWHNTLSLNRAKIENYCLVSKNEEQALGWVHNATHYWRNISSDCMNELKQNSSFKDPYKLEDGILLGAEKEQKTDFTSKSDAYSDKDGVQNIIGEHFEIKGLKSSKIFGKKRWYKVQFFSTENGSKIEEQKINTNIWGKLKPDYPTGNAPDYSYKISYLGEAKKAP